uniref:DB domain-containing protein n=1 Tax=Parastrongyloides trichosuri TaxID=131310 RepID=A0A0N4ZHK5_PARTI
MNSTEVINKLYNENRKKKEINLNNDNLQKTISQNSWSRKTHNNNQYIIYAPIKGEQVYTRVKYVTDESKEKKIKTGSISKNANIGNKKMIKKKFNSNHSTILVNVVNSTTASIFDNNELEYLSKSKGVIPIPQRPKTIEHNKITFIDQIVEKSKKVTLKKKLLNFFELSTLKTSTEKSVKITSPPVIINKPNKNKINRPILTADETLANCCIRKSISKECRSICSFQEISDKTLVQAVLTNKCPNGELKQVFECANNGDDHSICCFDQNVHLINNGQCMAFCSKTAAPITDVLQYFICLQVFEKIKNCYISNLNLVNSRLSSNSNRRFLTYF